MSKEDRLEREGWKIASTTGGEHLRRMLSMYEELGIDTYLEAIEDEECSACGECYRHNRGVRYRVYIRRQQARGHQGSDG